ncbi:hypothetical protein KZP23_04120 [Echinicola marina]|uniref:hypothetical protein n=1 Tax=Echinicola marina TaxID=2859768 RepID=UPI001CF69817|nr:hypothetical protein [Echinicola marina]UCS94226.1 hypothetical protein KZP23_04120 [Echinicola marina]
MYKATLLYTIQIALALTFFNAVNSYAQTYTYTASNENCSGQWNDGDCWTVTSTNCTTSATYPPTSLTSSLCETKIVIDGNLTLSSGLTLGGNFSTLTVTEGSIFTVTGNIKINDNSDLDIILEGENTSIDINGSLNYGKNTLANISLGGNNSTINVAVSSTMNTYSNIYVQFLGLNSSYNVSGNFDMYNDASFHISSSSLDTHNEISNYVNVGSLLMGGKSHLAIDDYSAFDVSGTTTIHTPSNDEQYTAVIDVDGNFYTKSISINGNTHFTFYVEEDSEVWASEPGGILDMNGNSSIIFNGDVHDGEIDSDADGKSTIDVGGVIDTNGSGAFIEADDAILYTCSTFPTDITKQKENEGNFLEENCRLLPVIWNNISGQWNTSTNKSQIQWSTIKEWENSHFEIERSIDNIDNFKTVGSVKAVGWSDQISNYQFDETLLLSNAPILYYRIKQFNLDGTYSFSPVIAIKPQSSHKDTGWLAYPNPTNGDHLSLASLHQEIPAGTPITITIYSSNQISKVLSKEYPYRSNINLDGLINKVGSGLHILEINWQDKSQKIKLLKR